MSEEIEKLINAIEVPSNITLIPQTNELQEEFIRNNINVPPHLLERSEARRRALGLPTRTELIEKEHNQTNLDKRLSGIIDLASEPCSLLAEHISTAASNRMRSVCTDVRIHDDLYDRDFIGNAEGIARGYFVGEPDDQPVATDYFYIRLADKVEGDPRIESLDLIASVRLVTTQHKKLFRKYVETHYEVSSPSQSYIEAVSRSNNNRYIDFNSAGDHCFPPSYAYVVANTRGNIAIPLFGISTERKRPDCSLVNPVNAGVDIADEIVVGREEIEDHDVREESFKELLRVLTDDSRRKRAWDEAKAEQKAFQVVKYSMPELIVDLGKLAVPDRINSVIGPANKEEESIVAYAQNAISKQPRDNLGATKQEVKSRIARTIVVNDIPYKGIVEITVGDEENARMHIDTEAMLPGAPNLPPQDVFPRVRIYRASDHPVCFEGIEVGSQQHKDMLAEFCELIGEATL